MTKSRWFGPLFALALLGCSGDDIDGGGAGEWETVALPFESGLGIFSSVWAFSETDVWLAGRSTWHFDGTAWSERPLPVGTDKIVDLWGLAPDDLWAVSEEQVVRWDGSSWVTVPTPPEIDDVIAIWASSPNDVWLADGFQTFLHHYDGTSWSFEFVERGLDLWGSGPTDVWMSTIDEPYHFDGQAWTEREGSSSTPADAEGLWGFSSTDVFAVGGIEARAVRFDGSNWVDTGANVADDLASVWGTSGDAVFATGAGKVARYDGDDWTYVEVAPVNNSWLFGIHGSSLSNIWIVGEDFEANKSVVLRVVP